MLHAGAMTPLEAEPLAVLRQRTSEKWTAFGPEVLPLFVAEMDYALAPVIADAMIARIAASDVGYAGPRGPVQEAFAGFAERNWGWSVDRDLVLTTTDVSVGLVETLRLAIQPGDGVVITPPVYPPFFDLVPEAGGTVAEVPLLGDGLDLAGMEAAFAGGAKAVLLCNPHNPLGLVHSRESLEALAALADGYGVTVVSDEIHGPLVHPGVQFTPYLSVSDAARDHGITVTSASKAFNIAGAKCALMVTGGDRMTQLLHALPEEVAFRTSQLGLHANAAAFAHGAEWLASAVAAITASSDLLAAQLEQKLPGAVYRQPRASYLAWLDFRALDWGDNPAERALEKGVALNSGLTFGVQGAGFARLNLACSPEVLTEAIDRLAS